MTQCCLDATSVMELPRVTSAGCSMCLQCCLLKSARDFVARIEFRSSACLVRTVILISFLISGPFLIYLHFLALGPYPLVLRAGRII